MLLRHAKSSWDDLDMDDRERPLNRRGHLAAPLIASFMLQEHAVPDVALVSPALRAQQTWSYCAKLFAGKTLTRTVEATYDFGEGEELFEAVRYHGGTTTNLLLVGHNPSIEGLASLLIGAGNATLVKRMTRKFPTAALAIIDLPGRNWKEIKLASGQLRCFKRPKDLV